MLRSTKNVIQFIYNGIKRFLYMLLREVLKYDSYTDNNKNEFFVLVYLF